MPSHRILFEPAPAPIVESVGTSGGPITQAQQAPASHRSADTPIHTGAEDNNLQAVMAQPDWSKDSDKTDLDTFRNRPVQSHEPKFVREAREAKEKAEGNTNEQSGETTETREAQTEGNLQQEQTLQDGTQRKANGEQEEIVQNDPSKEQQQQQQQRVDQQQQQQVDSNPIFKRFPEANIFGKKMDKSAREWMTARLNDLLTKEQEVQERDTALAEARQGIAKIPDNYYENPHAYVLLPQYQEAIVDANLAQQVYAHWNRQAVNVLNGKDWQPCDIQLDKPTGQYKLVTGAPQKYSENGMDYVMQQKDAALNQQALMNQNVTRVQEGFSKEVSTRLTRIKQASSELFPADVWEVKDSPQAKMVSNIKPSLQSLGITPANPAFDLLVKTGAALILERQYRQALEKKQGTQQSIQQDVKRAGPTGSATVGGGGKSSTKPGDDIDIDSFKSKLTTSRYG